MKKRIIFIILILALLFNTFGVIISAKMNSETEIETKQVTLTTDIEESHGENGYTYYIRYDDKKGEKGTFWGIDPNVYASLHKGDVVTVYRDKKSLDAESSDSDNGWHLSKEGAEKADKGNLIVFIILTMINILIINAYLRKDEKVNNHKQQKNKGEKNEYNI